MNLTKKYDEIYINADNNSLWKVTPLKLTLNGGTELPQQNIIDFISTAFTLNDDNTNNKTLVGLNTNYYQGIQLYTGSTLNLESNWSNNASSIDLEPNVIYFIINEYGVAYYAVAGQFGWIRILLDPYIKTNYATGLSIINELTTNNNWDTIFISSIGGQQGMKYIWGLYMFTCVSDNTWIREKIGAFQELEVQTDLLPRKQIVFASDNTTFILERGHYIKSIVLETINGYGGNFSIGTADGLTDIVSELPLNINIGDLQVLNINPMIANTTSEMIYYINIDTIVEVKCHIKYEKY